MTPRSTIEAFDRYLAGLGLRFEGVIVGGSALVLMGVVSRLTKDVDVLTPTLPEAVAAAARDFAKLERAAGKDLIDDWINNGPAQLGNVLPAGWRERIEPLFKGWPSAGRGSSSKTATKCGPSTSGVR